jgi:uncharacterized repeat protein (TIGR04076 family)
MAQSWDVKITVLKTLLVPEAVAANAAADSAWQPCSRHPEGQVWIVDGGSLDCPEGFCGWAWADLTRYVVTLARGGNFHGSQPGKTVASCTDGYRPVIFGLERIERGEGEVGEPGEE